MTKSEAVDANRLFLCSIFVSQIGVSLTLAFGVRDTMVQQLLMQLFLVLPCALYLVRKKASFQENIGRMQLGILQWLLLVPLAFCINKIGVFLNVFSQLFTDTSVANRLAQKMLAYPFVVAFLVVAVAPAVCEEFLFRGVLYQKYRESGICLAILLSGFLFGIMHMNLNQFCYAFVSGCLFALINEVMDSFLPGVLLHMFVNGRSVVALYMAVNYLTGLREQYVLAEAAGNTGRMSELVEQAQGIPLDKENWLEFYLNTESMEVGEKLISMLPEVLTAACVVLLILKILQKEKKKKEASASLQNEIEESGKKRWYCVASPSLIIGCALCILFMFV